MSMPENGTANNDDTVTLNEKAAVGRQQDNAGNDVSRTGTVVVGMQDDGGKRDVEKNYAATVEKLPALPDVQDGGFWAWMAVVGR